MLEIPKLIKIVKELNEDIENGIDNLSGVENISIETDGDITHLRFNNTIFWDSDEDDEISTKKDIEEILLHELKHHKTQIDGMIEMYERNN